MKPILLMVLDGFGYREEKEGNAIALAKTPNWDKFWKDYPRTLINASGTSVGLPDGTMGNSEVGHLNLGAGRTVHQEFTRINKAIEDKSFFANETLSDLFKRLKLNGGCLHLMGLVSDIGVHSHLNHLYALVDLAHDKGIKKIFIHCFTDGRDSPPDSGLSYIEQVEGRIKGKAVIATVMGRYYAMDRDERWDRIAKAYDAIVNGAGHGTASAKEAVQRSYKDGKTDEFIEPSVVVGEGLPVGAIGDNDAVIFFNFRADRARQLTRAMTDEKFAEFQRRPVRLTGFVTMTRYDETFKLPVVFPPEGLKNIFGEVIAGHGLHQLRIAETEKYAHVTYFFNGGEERVFKNEDRVLIPSPRDVPTYDKKPEMSAYKVTDEVVKRIESDKYDVIILNFANPDMVGHTGILAAAIKAVAAVDICMGKVVDAVLKKGGAVLITGDHGNCEEMLDGHGKPQTAHTTDVVPCVLIGKGLEKLSLRKGGALCDFAPTMLELLNLPVPKEMTGRSLIVA